MPTISNSQIIAISRGDSLTYPLFINIGTKLMPMRYPLQEGDSLYVGIMEPNAPFECSLIRLKLTSSDVNSFGDPVIRLRPSDTECLLPGLYYYEAKLESVRDSGTQVHTVVPRRKFMIVE